MMPTKYTHNRVGDFFDLKKKKSDLFDLDQTFLI